MSMSNEDRVKAAEKALAAYKLRGEHLEQERARLATLRSIVKHSESIRVQLGINSTRGFEPHTGVEVLLPNSKAKDTAFNTRVEELVGAALRSALETWVDEQQKALYAEMDAQYARDPIAEMAAAAGPMEADYG